MKTDRRGIREDISFVLSIINTIGIVLIGLNFYFTWYVPPRAELSILVESFSYLPSQDIIRVDVSGLVVNEGARSTTIKGVGFRYHFRNKDDLEILFNYSLKVMRFEKNILAEEESSSFTFTDHLPLEMILKYGEWEPEDFKDFTIIIVHDDGIGLISNSKTILVE